MATRPWDRRELLRWLSLSPLAGAAAVAGFGVDWRGGIRHAAGGTAPHGGTRGFRRGPLHDAPSCEPTTADVEGPFYVAGAPSRTSLAGPDEPGDRIVIRGRVLGPDCRTPLPNALLDVWQADAEGSYHSAEEEYRLRGALRTDREGRYEFASVMPGRYPLVPGSSTGFRPAHIHFTVGSPGHVPLTTQLYFEGDPFLAPKDACGEMCRSDDPGRIIELVKADAGPARFAGTFDIVLAQGRA
ncbi:MAG TPA: twin-arginine translocation pathway signal protein [Gemmatimonadota bacterium]|jgi:catechol 1,2-dioxygenase